MKRLTRSLTLVVAALAVAACDPLDPHDPTALSPDGPDMRQSAPSSATVAAISAMMAEVNEDLESSSAPYRLYAVEFITGEDSDEAGATVLRQDVGNKQLSHDFVPFDPRRQAWSGPVDGADDDITWAVDQTADGAPVCCDVSVEEATTAIEAAMASWDAEACSDMALTRVDDGGENLGALTPGAPVIADITHAGFRQHDYAGGVLGVTHTFIWGATVDGVFIPSDIDGNGKYDVAFREIYYDSYHPNPGFVWWWDLGDHIDVESIALHEAGHGFSQAHFGNIFRMDDGSLMAAPRAVMNALYTDPLTVLTGTDDGGHCSNWADYPLH